jgi:hypothetical protein
VDPPKPPHERLNIRRIASLQGNNINAGPNIIIHKHSRAIAFSIIRGYNFGKNDRLGSGVLLATKKVQERYTHTRNTSKLVTHGLLADGQGGHEHTDHRNKGKNKVFSETYSDDTTHIDTLVIGHSFNQPSPSAPILAPLKINTATSLYAGNRTVPGAVLNTTMEAWSDALESVSDHSTVRSLHAYERPPLQRREFSAIDSAVAQQNTFPAKPDANVSFFKRWLRPGHKPVSLGGDYKPPWMTTAPQSRQEEVDRVINKLNYVLMGVGLVPTNAKPMKKSKNRSKGTETSGILEHLSDDTLYMLLPLWSIQAPPKSSASNRQIRPAPLAPPLEDRCYLLVYYVPFPGKPPKGLKKRMRSSPTSSADSTKSDERNILLTEFRVCACAIRYADFRGSGVRLPSDGLLVSDSAVDEPLPCVPDTGDMLNDPHGSVIGMYHGKERGVEFVPEGILKLGLCLELPSRSHSQNLFKKEVEGTPLSTLGRAVVEMVWAGCMALSSFGST